MKGSGSTDELESLEAMRKINIHQSGELKVVSPDLDHLKAPKTVAVPK